MPELEKAIIGPDAVASQRPSIREALWNLLPSWPVQILPKQRVSGSPSEKDEISSVESGMVRVESVLIWLTIGAIAYGDFLAGPNLSLGYLYLVPLSYSLLTHRLRTSLCLSLICVFLRQVFGPIELSSWGFFIRDWVLTAIFLSLVAALYRLGTGRRRLFERARDQRDELVKEVQLAAEVQNQLLSHKVPAAAGLDIIAQTFPSKGVGGDYYDLIPVESGRVGVVIADIAGKGLPAALLMPAFQIALRTLSTRHVAVGKVLGELNQLMYEVTPRASYATLFFGVLDPKSGSLHYANAGHLPGLLLRAKAGNVEWLKSGGTPIGLLPEAAYGSSEVRLKPGDWLVLYTDGVIEPENEQEEAFGLERLAAVVRRGCQGPASELSRKLCEAVLSFSPNEYGQDDLTVITVRIPEGRLEENGQAARE